jgi:hypothetical protein
MCQLQDVKNVINCIGGVHALFPLLERGAQVRMPSTFMLKKLDRKFFDLAQNFCF